MLEAIAPFEKERSQYSNYNLKKKKNPQILNNYLMICSLHIIPIYNTWFTTTKHNRKTLDLYNT
jgi:hypothetical protein